VVVDRSAIIGRLFGSFVKNEHGSAGGRPTAGWLFASLGNGQVALPALIGHKETQNYDTFCGAASTVAILNTIGVTGPTMSRSRPRSDTERSVTCSHYRTSSPRNRYGRWA
jgi:hypothetical protein